VPLASYDETSAQSVLLAQSGRAAGDIGPIPDVGADGLARLISEYHNTPRIQSLLLALLHPIQALDDTAYQVLTEVWNLDTAVGDQLDMIGDLVSEPRDARADDAYRVSLRVRVLVNNSNGTAEELLAITSLYAPEGGTIRIEGYQPKTIGITTDARPDDPVGLVARLREAREAGASLTLIYPASTLAESFAFSTDYVTPGTSTAQGLGDVYGPTIGGQLSAVL